MSDPASIYESVLAEQEKFAQLTEQLAAERRTVANQLEKVRLSRDSGMSGSGYLDENSSYRGWNNIAPPSIPEDYESDPDPTDPVLVNRKVDTKVDKKVYRSERIQRRVIGDPGYGTDGTFYQQDEAPIHESRYTTTHTNCQPNADLLDNGSLESDPNLVSRNTSSTTTQEVTTVTKVYRTYERVPNETLTSSHGLNNRDYDYPEDYIADYESQLYAKPYRKYGSPQRFDYVNGMAHGNGSSGDVFDRSDLYGSNHSTKSKRHPSSIPHDDVGYASYMGDMAGDEYSPASAAVGTSGSFATTVADGHHGPLPSYPHTHTTPHPLAQFRDPELPEVIEFLRHPSNVIKANAAAHLAHLAYNNDQIKNTTRQLNGIPPLVEMLTSSVPEIQRNACSALRNLSFGRGNDENKKAIRSSGGLGTLIKILKQSQESDTSEVVTAMLWILSSCDELKKPILDEACPLLIKQIVLPHSGYRQPPNVDPHQRTSPAQYNSTVFRNSSGVLRNVSSAGFQARKSLRESENFIMALLYMLKDAVRTQDIENKSIENVVCILRNLSFRCQEVEDPDYDKKRHPNTKKSDKGTLSAPGSLNGTPAKNTAYSNLKGIETLWSVDNVQGYLAILSKCANFDTLEAAAGVLQNLSACYWQISSEKWLLFHRELAVHETVNTGSKSNVYELMPAIEIRAAVRKEKGLPILVELLRMEHDKVVCSVARALRNLAVDQRNRELIGKYAMRDLTAKIPSPDSPPPRDSSIPTSDETIAAILATINEVVKKHPEFARVFLDMHGVQSLVHITTNYNQYSSKVVRFAFLILQALWAHHELHNVYRSAGWKESHFLSKPPNMSTKTLGGNDTLGRTFSSQGATKFEDKTLPRGSVPPEDELDGIPMNAVGSSKNQNGAKRGNEPVYAQVNRAEKIRQRQIRENGNGNGEPSTGVALEDGVGGDSWV